MGMYGELASKLDTGPIVKLEVGKQVRVRLLEHVWVARPQFDDGNVAVQYLWPIWDYAQNRPRILRGGQSIFNQIGAIIEDQDGDGYELPSPFDLKITRSGSGRNDTKYQVTGVPHAGTMPSAKSFSIPDMVDFSKGHALPMDRIMQGDEPPIYLASTGEVVAGEAPALESGRQRDNIPTDDDVQNINLDEIPW